MQIIYSLDINWLLLSHLFLSALNRTHVFCLPFLLLPKSSLRPQNPPKGAIVAPISDNVNPPQAPEIQDAAVENNAIDNVFPPAPAQLPDVSFSGFSVFGLFYSCVVWIFSSPHGSRFGSGSVHIVAF